MQADCGKCRQIPDDIIAVLVKLSRLKNERFRGTVQYHLDGSGRIESCTTIESKELQPYRRG